MAARKNMWQKLLENAKLIISSVLLMASFLGGSWALVTGVFITKAEASEYINRFEIEIAYNKAFRIETRISRLEKLQKTRELSDAEKRELNRLKRNLERIDLHIASYEDKLTGDHITNN